MLGKEKGNCAGCYFWKQENAANYPKGICRFNPPGSEGWTETEAEDWCGKFQSQKPESVVQAIVGIIESEVSQDIYNGLEAIAQAIEKIAEHGLVVVQPEE